MSGTPIFEQLYRDYVDAGKAWAQDVARPPVPDPPRVPAHSAPVAGDVPAYGLDDHLPRAFAELACPVD
ncbi:MAG: hypothetical protein ACRDSR_07115 [Pseudonocardiaceae bacterium]